MAEEVCTRARKTAGVKSPSNWPWKVVAPLIVTSLTDLFHYSNVAESVSSCSSFTDGCGDADMGVECPAAAIAVLRRFRGGVVAACS